MQIKNKKETKNPLFNRNEILLEVESESTPSHTEVKELISKEFSTPEDSMKVKAIKGSFGSKIFNIEANLYHSKQEMDKIEFKTKKEIEAEKKALEEAKKAEEEKLKAEQEAKAAEETAKAESKKPAEPSEEKSEVPEQEKAEQKEQDEKTEKEVKEVNQEEKGE